MLTKQQYKFLKKVSKKEIPCDDLHEKGDRIYLYLLNKKFIETFLVCPDGDVLQRNAKLYCRASESGNVELLLCKQERFHFWIPTIISIIALIISILSIYNAPFVWTYVQETFVQSTEEDH